eukprot:CAMPEP_0201889676 /NCGR_PEP_ID=MMETSP0902-20130614/30556_1 /ASSEMBLY_ACC=CAM_ASM_000551 /TAXON_ID=420261 /ORGANISM="Thalassiosira antarctica, Strain CCMP982" /LENGTH=61 /DNA_ID=CAMNT_0048420325 /DNA_START=102 /DNA_END=287 /DNA_ORIENTATION=-
MSKSKSNKSSNASKSTWSSSKASKSTHIPSSAPTDDNVLNDQFSFSFSIRHYDFQRVKWDD